MPNVKLKGLKKYSWVGKKPKKSKAQKVCENYANYKGKHPKTRKRLKDFNR